MKTIKLCDGKYEFDVDPDGWKMLDARRNGEHWDAGMEFRFAKSVMAMLVRIVELEEADRRRQIVGGLPVRYLDEAKRPRAVRDMLSGKTGLVKNFSEPNPPWHEGGVPFVGTEDGESGYWYFTEPLS